MRIAWTVVCGWVRPSSTPGRLDLFDCQIDALVVGSRETEIEFDVAIRLLGLEADFAEEHTVRVALNDPDLAELNALDLPVFPRVPAPHRRPGDELSAHVGARIAFHVTTAGPYNVSFALDGGLPDHRHNAPISVALLDSN